MHWNSSEKPRVAKTRNIFYMQIFPSSVFQMLVLFMMLVKGLQVVGADSKHADISYSCFSTKTNWN